MTLGAAVTLGTTFLLVALGFCLTLHIAARYALGDVPIRNALIGVVPAAIVFTLTLADRPLVGAPVAIAADLIAVRSIYGISYRWAGLVTVVHFTVSFLLGLMLGNLLSLLETAPT